MRTREEAARFIEKQFRELEPRQLGYDGYDARDLLDFIYGLPKKPKEDLQLPYTREVG